ncbi:hypothetical protein ElyMa_004327700 [Elysia marginata]|uniref:Uncharacterized protein n=1 Tax=Elysia marginata TaxID=1093978 RepID=A0AAV4H1H4_9GAST|nr:hypothetical protein ElyMa_004327700 [Elysia marginata]
MVECINNEDDNDEDDDEEDVDEIAGCANDSAGESHHDQCYLDGIRHATQCFEALYVQSCCGDTADDKEDNSRDDRILLVKMIVMEIDNNIFS